ncbi:interleukin-5 receptor subunit alpha-like [Odontesthes bonariensis]|uniref:interleukin-5 receptor subunit alpha-like n=1 Tax=Odontesthes bonariensis TaxID=219752 RepID=UPI003F583F95
MKLCPAPPILWLSLLVLLVSQRETKGRDSDLCEKSNDIDIALRQDSTGFNMDGDVSDEIEASNCLLYPNLTLNCSWSFRTLEKDAQLSVYISVCNGDTSVESRSQDSVERVGSVSLMLNETEMDYQIILHFNMSLDDKWTAYTLVYGMETQLVLPPPRNISASIKGGSLNITWDLPDWERANNDECYDYQLDMGDQGYSRNLTGKVFYTEPNADPSRTYRVRMRARMSTACYGCDHWSDWSPTVTVEHSLGRLDPLVIISISLGIPMILLTLLLLLRHQRFTEVLFPPIPHPPAKYKYFLERSDPLTFFQQAPPAKVEEVITEVEDADQNAGKTY